MTQFPINPMLKDEIKNQLEKIAPKKQPELT
jgi:hypothetical protein